MNRATVQTSFVVRKYLNKFKFLKQMYKIKFRILLSPFQSIAKVIATIKFKINFKIFDLHEESGRSLDLKLFFGFIDYLTNGNKEY